MGDKGGEGRERVGDRRGKRERERFIAYHITVHLTFYFLCSTYAFVLLISFVCILST